MKQNDRAGRPGRIGGPDQCLMEAVATMIVEQSTLSMAAQYHFAQRNGPWMDLAA